MQSIIETEEKRIFIRRGKSFIEIDPIEIEQIFRFKDKQYMSEDAERHLYEYFGIERDCPKRKSKENRKRFEETFKTSIEDACKESSEHYLLNDLIEIFSDCFDCNISENAQWDSAIVELIDRYH